MATLQGLSPAWWSLAGTYKFRRNSARRAGTNPAGAQPEITRMANSHNLNEECACTHMNA